jgi:hypothetical protein
VAGEVPEAVLRAMLGPEHGAGLGAAALRAAGAQLEGAMVVVFGVVAVLGAAAVAAE